MDLTRGLKVCCGIWHQDASSRSFTTCQPPGFGLRGSDMLVQQHPSDACFDRDLGNLEAESTPQTYCYHHELSHCRNICVSPIATRNKLGPIIKEVETLYSTGGDRPTLAAYYLRLLDYITDTATLIWRTPTDFSRKGSLSAHNRK